MYPHWSRRANFIPIPDLLTRYSGRTKSDLDASPLSHSITGRITRIRESSRKLLFIDLVQEQARSQLILNRGGTFFAGREEEFDAILGKIGRGNIVEAEGLVTRTLTGELSLQVRSLELLATCKVNLPADELDLENRMRHRHLDMLCSTNVIGTLKARSKIIRDLRAHLDSLGFTEIETPILGTRYGGAMARPFLTHHTEASEAEGRPLYLRIAPELSLKQLVVGGLDRVYEVGKVFRNEGMDAEHNPEFTSCEFYQAYANCKDMMELTEELIRSLASSGLQSNLFAGPFRRIEICEALERELGARLPLDEPDEVARERLLAMNLPFIKPTLSLAKIYDKLISHYLEPLCKEPTFLTGHPMSLSPLSKCRPDNPHLADRFELFIAGTELANGFSEQNDPDLQLQAFMKQAKARQGGDEEAQCLDEEFVGVLKAGLPPTGGCGIGIDRLVMLLTGQAHIRDVLAFPMVRPKP